MSKVILTEISTETATQLVELPTDLNEALQQIFLTLRTLVKGSPEQSKGLAHTLIEWAARQTPPAPCCLINLANVDEFERLTVDVSLVEHKLSIQPGILARTLESDNGILLIYNAQLNSEGINDIFDGSFWQLHETQLRIAKGLKIVGIAPIESKLDLKTYKISPAQSGRYLQTRVLPTSLEVKQFASLIKKLPSTSAENEVTIDCGFRSVETLEAYLLGTPPLQKNGKRKFIPGILTMALRSSPTKIVFLNVLQADIAVDCFVLKAPLEQSLLNIGEPSNLKDIKFYVDNSPPKIRKKIISLKSKACQGLTNIVWITNVTAPALSRSILKIEEDQSYFLYEDSTGIIDKVGDPDGINWVISGNLIAKDFYPLLTLPNLYILDNVSVPLELKAHVDRQAGTIEDTKISTPIAEPWLKVIIHEDKHRQAVLNKLTTEHKRSQIIYISGHDTRLIEPLWQALQAKQLVILTDLAKNPELLEALQNFFSGAVGYRDLQGEWLLPATTGGKAILLVSPEEYSKQVWLQELAQQELTLPPSSTPEPPISSDGLKNFASLSAMLNHGKRFIFCKGADPWQQDDAIACLQEDKKAQVWTYKLGPSTGFADFEDKLMQWAEDQKSSTPQIFVFTGEMSSPALLFLQGLFGVADIVLPNSQRVSLSDQHVVIFFQDVGVKKSLALLENLATPVAFTPLTFSEMETQFLQPLMKSENLDTVDPLLRLLNDWLARWQINLSIGDYLAIIGRIAAHDCPLIIDDSKVVKTTPLIIKWAAAAKLVVSPYLKPDMQLAFDCWLLMLPDGNNDKPYYEITTDWLLQADETIVDTPQTRHGLNFIFQYLQSCFYFSQKNQRMPGKTALAVVGETMAGKSFLVRKALQFVLEETGYRLVNGGPYAQLHHDTIKLTVCSELNLVAAELLNQIGHIPLIGTLNPPGERYESRQKLPPALAARMFQLNLATPPTADLLNIHKIAPEYHVPLLEFHTYAAGYASTRSLINAGQLCQQQGRFELASCFQAYGHALWDTDELIAGRSLIAAPQTGCRKTFFYFFEGLGERELYINFSTEETAQLFERTKEIRLPFPPATFTVENYLNPLARLLRYSIEYWVISASDTALNYSLTNMFPSLLAYEILNKYYPAIYRHFFRAYDEELGKVLNDFSHKAAEWIEIKSDVNDLSFQNRRIFLFMVLLQAFRTNETIHWPDIAQQLNITDYSLLMNLLDIQDLHGSDKATIKDYIHNKKIPLIKAIIERFTLTEEIKEIKIEKHLIGSPGGRSATHGAPRQYRTLAQISPPKKYYFPTNHFSLDETGLPITSGQDFQVPRGIPEECSLPVELDQSTIPGDPVTIELHYSELADVEEMLLPMPTFHGLGAELPDHFECYYRDGNHYVRKASHQNNEKQFQPFSYKVIPYDILSDFKLQDGRQSVPALPLQESRLPPKIQPLLSALKSAFTAEDVQLALTNLHDGLRNYLQYILDDAEDDEAREFRFNLQAAYVGDQGQIDLLKMLYFCFDTRKVFCLESMSIFIILLRYSLGNAVKIHVLGGLMSDDTGKLTDESHTWIMINGIVFDPTPPKLLRQKVVQPHSDSPPTTEEKTSDEKQIKQEQKPKPAPKPELESESQPAPKPEAKSETESKTESEPDPELKSESQPASKPKTESEPEVKLKPKSEFKLFSRPESKNNDKKSETKLVPRNSNDHKQVSFEWEKDRDLIVLRLEPLFKILGGQSPQAGKAVHTHFSMSQDINHRRAAAGLPAFIKKSFPISFTPMTLISLSFPMHDCAHFLVQCLLEKGFKLGVPDLQGIVEISSAVDFIAKTRELNSADEKEIERFKTSSDLLCREMRSDDWSKIFKLFDEILQTVVAQEKQEKFAALPKGVRDLQIATLHIERDNADYFRNISYGKKNTTTLQNLTLTKYPNSRNCLEYFAERLREINLELSPPSSTGIFKPKIIITLPKYIIINHEIEVKTTLNVLCLSLAKKEGKKQEISQFMTNIMQNGLMTSSNSSLPNSLECTLVGTTNLAGKTFHISPCIANSVDEARDAALGKSIIFAFDEACYLPQGPKIVCYIPSIKQGSLCLHPVAHTYWSTATDSIPIKEISTKAFESSNKLLIQSLKLITTPAPTPSPPPNPEQNSQCLLQ